MTGYMSPPMDVTEAKVSRPPGCRKHRWLRTLDPALLDREDLIDFSNTQTPRIPLQNCYGPDKFQIKYMKHNKRIIPFPSGTFGYLYFHAHPDPICSRLRFRIISMSRNFQTFDAGHDLLLPNGLPWEGGISSNLKGVCNSELLDMLIRDSLLSRSARTQLEDSMAKHTVTRPWVVAPGEIFMLKLAIVAHKLYLGKGYDHMYAPFRPPWRYAPPIVESLTEPRNGGYRTSYIILRLWNVLMSL
jgi:hypothetical protein